MRVPNNYHERRKSAAVGHLTRKAAFVYLPRMFPSDNARSPKGEEMKYLLALTMLLLLSACGEVPENGALFCPDYRNTSTICTEVCGKFWAKQHGEGEEMQLLLYTSKSNCFSNVNPIFEGVPSAIDQ